MPRRPKRNDEVTKLDASVLRMARHVVIHRGMPLAEYLSSILKPIVERDFHKTVKELEHPKGD